MTHRLHAAVVRIPLQAFRFHHLSPRLVRSAHQWSSISEGTSESQYYFRRLRSAEIRQRKMEERQRAVKRPVGKPKPTPDVRVSKTLSYILRHGAQSEGLFMRADGYVRVTDLLALPKFRSVNFLTLERIVQEDEKMRYHLLMDVDVQGEGSNPPSAESIWWIRANQGHSLKSVELDMTELIDPGQVPMAVHGTSTPAWKKIEKQGLSKMKRNHIHLAQGLADDGVISGMRTTSQVLIYINLAKALKDGIKFYVSANGVILSPGNEEGFIPPQYFRRVERINRQALPGWEKREENLEKTVTDASHETLMPTVVSTAENRD